MARTPILPDRRIVNFAATGEMVAVLKRQAAVEQTGVSDLVRKAVRRYLQNPDEHIAS